MKTKVFTAITVAAIFCMFTFFHCGNDKPPLPSNIAGEWVVDSIYASYSTTDSMRQEIAVRLMDEKKKVFVFNPDSSLTRKPSTDTIPGKYYVRYGSLYLDDSKHTYPYEVEVISDSILKFTSSDRMRFILKKK